mmetsp:Transcript_26035/g.61193  ORF Transcript_26035/g.61193 Transcript_26035/m.61193 type:complete len:139 (+) Transcript_26035:66-482(+)|eukprot:CAMPEP_0172402618 /NCGR_PEP_ID=MMETSP1061-20121228/55325_1 /TAXON_ID=37318 /ORGANISM="Pseudo-nitzschia pungens, Strain cf. pungens" /LENGTH=138 /DNA_ID=CAMNT_0013136673 /DNA_START=8 /DNA_END=424 /DNA_ORIENTATION=-
MRNSCDSPQEFVDVPFSSCDAGCDAGRIERPSPIALRSSQSMMSINSETTFPDNNSGTVRLGSFDSPCTANSAFSVVPKAIGFRPFYQQEDAATLKHLSSSDNEKVVRVPDVLRRPIVEFVFDDTNGEIPPHLLFPIL